MRSFFCVLYSREINIYKCADAVLCCFGSCICVHISLCAYVLASFYTILRIFRLHEGKKNEISAFLYACSVFSVGVNAVTISAQDRGRGAQRLCAIQTNSNCIRFTLIHLLSSTSMRSHIECNKQQHWLSSCIRVCKAHASPDKHIIQFSGCNRSNSFSSLLNWVKAIARIICRIKTV